MPASRALLLPLVLLLALAGCGGSSGDAPEGPLRPEIGARGEEPEAATDLGFPTFATKNTTRVGGADPVADAAGVARAVFPGTTRATRPRAVTLVDAEDWRAGVAASALVAEPIGAPVLLSDGNELPPSTEAALEALAPTGSREVGGGQVLRVGAVAEPDGLRATEIGGRTAPELANAIDLTLSTAQGRTSDRVVVVGTGDAGWALPAAGWAAKSGDPVLFTDRDTLPGITRQALERHQQPRIYVLGPREAVSDEVERELRRLGTVTRIEGEPQLGASFAPAPSDRAVVGAVEADGPAQRAGLRPDDVVLRVGTTSVRSPDDVVTALGRARAGDRVPIVVRRGDDERTLNAVVPTDPVANAIAFARFVDGPFGWGASDAGHGLTFVDVERPLDAVAAAPLSSSGSYAPILLHDGAERLSPTLAGHLEDIRPGYRSDPVRGVYNHGWLIGDESAVTTEVQAEIDALLEIQPVDEGGQTAPGS